MKHVLLKIDKNLLCFQKTDETTGFAEIASCNFNKVSEKKALKVHKIENFFGSELEFYTISLLVMLKY